MKEMGVAFVGSGDTEEAVQQAEIDLEFQLLVAHLVITGGTDATLLAEGLYPYFQLFPYLIDECKQYAIR